ncbi:DUF6969 family protein [Thalassospira mesophila]|uniref:DUF6969 domain-containing protein n=1 Tax=Thalassospira mesophila TaxID=1293891 RepID=A0A1Y2L065_9PROT|nr:hypothetical protein [Thalassospira mesophila]OSQ38382.1 hypothetical protein TMES_11035 [Thalassospira mesophila]
MTELEINWSELSTSQLKTMMAAGRDVMECHRVLSATGDNIVGELIRTTGAFYEWTHYPQGDVYDRTSHGQFYYHAHPKDEQRDWAEHGHFHSFMRPRGMPESARPLPIPGVELPKGPNEALSHLIAISMDQYGFAQRLFTTNRWVTGEVWYDAETVISMLDNFIVDHAQPSWPVNRWVSGMIAFYRPQIEILVRQRDEVITRWVQDHPDADVYEDRDLEVTSQCPIRVEEQMRHISTELANRR